MMSGDYNENGLNIDELSDHARETYHDAYEARFMVNSLIRDLDQYQDENCAEEEMAEIKDRVERRKNLLDRKMDSVESSIRRFEDYNGFSEEDSEAYRKLSEYHMRTRQKIRKNEELDVVEEILEPGPELRGDY